MESSASKTRINFGLLCHKNSLNIAWAEFWALQKRYINCAHSNTHVHYIVYTLVHECTRTCITEQHYDRQFNHPLCFAGIRAWHEKTLIVTNPWPFRRHYCSMNLCKPIFVIFVFVCWFLFIVVLLLFCFVKVVVLFVVLVDAVLHWIPK